jgi:predicted site-specific integrase-resolvase
MTVKKGEQHTGETAWLRREAYSLRQFSTLTGISVTALRRGIQKEDLPVKAVRIGGQWMFPRRPVDRLLGIDED